MNANIHIHPALTQVWEKINEAYSRGAIVSERHLQAIFYKEWPMETKIELWIEPKINTHSGNTKIDGLIPDILLTQEKEILAVIELKYVPNHYPQFEKDFNTFHAFYTSMQKENPRIYLLTNPDNGDWKRDSGDVFSLSKNIEFIHMSIANKDSWLYTNFETCCQKHCPQHADIPFKITAYQTHVQDQNRIVVQHFSSKK